MKITGQLDTDGNAIDFTEEIEVVEFGNTLRDKNGMCWAVKDDYGDWVNPGMRSLGIRCPMVVTE